MIKTLEFGMQHFVDPTKEAFAKTRSDARPGSVHMLNLIRLYEIAKYADGRQSTGAEAYEQYSLLSAPVLQRLGGLIHWQGAFEQTLVGPQDEQWNVCFIASYPSIAAFVEMVRDPVYREAVKHRQAAVQDSRLIRLKPLRSGNRFGQIPS